MWTYERKLQYPVKITRPNPAIAKFIMSQYGGPDGEMGASMRYLSQRYSMDNKKVAGLLTDIATEELGHLEMVAAIIRQLTKGCSAEELKESGLAGIEAVYCTYTQGEEAQMRKFASKYDLLISGGSDFHGSNKPGLELATGYHGKLFIPYDIWEKLKYWKQQTL